MEFSSYKNSTLDSWTCLCIKEAGKSGSCQRSYLHALPQDDESENAGDGGIL